MHLGQRGYRREGRPRQGRAGMRASEDVRPRRPAGREEAVLMRLREAQHPGDPRFDFCWLRRGRE